MVPNSFGSEPSWYVIYTHPKQEDRARYNLNAWQVETFTPMCIERRYNQFTGKPQNVVKHLFPRYIFARFRVDQLLHKVCFTRGVKSVVSFGGNPAVVDDEIIETIRERIGADGYVRLSEDLKPGDKVIIRSGPLKDFVGMFESRTKDQARISILLTTINFQSHVLVEREMAAKVAV